MSIPQPLLSRARHYAWGFLATAWNGGWSAVAGILGIDAMGMTGATQQVRILNWREMGAAFIGAFLLHGIIWLKSHPLPDTYDTPAPFPPTAPPSSP